MSSYTLTSILVKKKVNIERRDHEIYPTKEEFYPTLHRLLTGRRNWGSTFQFRGRAIFMIGVMEWTKRFSYHFDLNVWWAFCELWGPLTNTVHHGAGEVNISPYDLERIGGLPILGAIYAEFLPLNENLTGHNKYPATVAELLHIHAELCREQINSEQEIFETKEKSPLRISRKKRMADLNVTTEGELAAFLAFWLSRFV
ncbi:hypothetical protein Cgig2_028031 [Carnegiea gigantea]|uniref:Aminotransferase-like plant mobile domain-containing protein n=1 Tax=Carnegiea gigantea TaxID=171969 RepID=A0A9Q1GWC5_9CARY|nr:hypothetical protein Cgig2_028031 [Carnegiea gigantea]